MYILMHHLLQPSSTGRYGSAFLADVLTTALLLVLFTAGEAITSNRPAGPSASACPGPGEGGLWLQPDGLKPPQHTDLLRVERSLAPAKSHLEAISHKTSPIKATATHFDSSQIALLSLFYFS